MKKPVAVFIALMMLLFACGSAGADNAAGTVALYKSSFKDGLDGWYAVSGEELYVNAKKSLGTRNRTADWNGPRRDFIVEEDTVYEITAEVFQKETDTATFVLSRAYTEGGETTYINLVRVDAPKKKWTPVRCNWTPEFSGTCTLYIETSGAPELSYEIRNFCVSKAPSEDESFVQTYQKNFAKTIDKTITQLKELPFPAFMTENKNEISAWIPDKEIPETASLAEVKAEDGKITVDLDRKVTNMSWLEVTWQEGFYINEQADISCSKSSYAPEAMNNRIIMRFAENLEQEKTLFTCTQEYEYNPETSGMELSYTDTQFNLAVGEYSPYDQIKKASGWADVIRRRDGSVSRLEYTLTGNGVANSLTVKTYLDENGQAEKFIFSRGGDAGKMSFYADLTTDGAYHPVSLTWHVFNSANYLSFTLEQPDPSDPNSFYMPAILEKYTRAQVNEPDAVMWAYTLDFGSGCMIQYYLTKDELLVVDENGFVRLNEDARDVKGKPFPAMGVSPLIDPALYALP